MMFISSVLNVLLVPMMQLKTTPSFISFICKVVGFNTFILPDIFSPLFPHTVAPHTSNIVNNRFFVFVIIISLLFIIRVVILHRESPVLEVKVNSNPPVRWLLLPGQSGIYLLNISVRKQTFR